MSHTHRQQVARAKAYQAQLAAKKKPVHEDPLDNDHDDHLAKHEMPSWGEERTFGTQQEEEPEVRGLGATKVAVAEGTDLSIGKEDVSLSHELGDLGGRAKRLAGSTRADKEGKLSERNYLDVGAAKAGASGELGMNKDGAKAKLAGEASASLLEGQAQTGVEGTVGKVDGAVSGSVLGAKAAGSLEAGWDRSKGTVGAKGEAEIGAHLAKAKGSLSGGFRVPFTNILLGGDVSAEGEIGAGAKASGHATAGANGFSMGGKIGGSLGLGGSLGANFSVSKADDKQGWFGGGGWW